MYIMVSSKIFSNLYNNLFRKNHTQKGGESLSFFHNIKSGNFIKLLHNKKEFITLIFANLILQLLITYYVMENTNKNANGKDEKKPISIKLIVVFFIVSLFAVSALVSNHLPIWAKIILFTLFSAMEGYMLSFIKYVVDPAVIKMAIAGTMGIFTTMFIFGMILIFMGVTLGVYVGLILLFALLGLIITRIVYMFMGDYSQVSRGLAIFSLGLFSLFIIYDTNQIMQRDYFGDFIKASLDYYLDIINIFLNLTRLMDDN